MFPLIRDVLWIDLCNEKGFDADLRFETIEKILVDKVTEIVRQCDHVTLGIAVNLVRFHAVENSILNTFCSYKIFDKTVR